MLGRAARWIDRYSSQLEATTTEVEFLDLCQDIMDGNPPESGRGIERNDPNSHRETASEWWEDENEEILSSSTKSSTESF